jgi:hypothetical protein
MTKDMVPMPIIDYRITLGSLLQVLSVIIAASVMMFQLNNTSNARMEQVKLDAVQEAKNKEDLANAIQALGVRVGDVVERLQALSEGATQRFSSLDAAIDMVGKRVDSLQTSTQGINDRLVIQEAKVMSLQDEIKTIVGGQKPAQN